MKITLIAYGTRGDVQPAIALGKALQARGHRLRLLASPNFKSWIESHGLEAAPAKVDVQAVMNSEGGQEWVEIGNNPLKQLQVMRRLLKKDGLAMIQDAWEACQDAEAIVSQFTSVVYAGSLAARRGIPHLCMLLQPALLATRDGRAMINAPRPGKSLLNYWMGKIVIERAAWGLYGDITNRFRRETLGLPPLEARRFLEEFVRLPILMGYSPRVSPRPDDWPDNYCLTGYWYLDEGRDWQAPAELQRFLAEGEPPVCIGFGSMIGRNVEATTRIVVEAVTHANERAILISGWAGLGKVDLPPAILRIDSAPHDWLLPRVATLVHHGGAGTTASAFRAGVPQVVVPHMADQPFWGRRVAALGVGPKPIPRPKLSAQMLAAAIQEAASPEMKRRAGILGHQIREEDGLGIAVKFIQKHLGA
jgi:UDP:flavonoid glycosyltransferase YjiC (YdhE family)